MHAFICAVDSYALGEEDTVGALDRDTTSKVATYTRGGAGGSTPATEVSSSAGHMLLVRRIYGLCSGPL